MASTKTVEQSTRRATLSTDMTDAEWQLIAPYLAPHTGLGAPRTVDIRAVVDAIWYRLRTECQWRMLPVDFPAWPTVYYYFRQWDDGTWERMNTALRQQLRHREGRDPEPSAAIIDSQRVKTTDGNSWLKKYSTRCRSQYRSGRVLNLLRYGPAPRHGTYHFLALAAQGWAWTIVLSNIPCFISGSSAK